MRFDGFVPNYHIFNHLIRQCHLPLDVHEADFGSLELSRHLLDERAVQIAGDLIPFVIRLVTFGGSEECPRALARGKTDISTLCKFLRKRYYFRSSDIIGLI
jgi:hypothetical protein